MLTTQSVCTAHISVNKNRVKIYRNVNGYADHSPSVFLKDGQNFEIELYNQKQNSVLAKISLNGKDISSSGIVLRPGQRVYIERFIDTPRKFEFSTYEVGDTVQNRTAIANNGEVEVRFYDEYIPYSFGGSTITTSYPTWTTNPCYIYSTGNVGIGTSSPTTNFSLTSGTSTAFYSNGTITNTGTLNAHVAGSLETGRIEQGKSSGQSFSTTNGTFNSYACSTETIKLLPASQKPVESAEIRNYCTNCGTRAKKTGWKFCPSCGSKF
jgi:hypothetical protein